MKVTKIRGVCLQPGRVWERPTGDEIREVLRLAQLSGSEAADVLGLGEGGGRTVRRWTSMDTGIPYAAWALLCEVAGLGLIWRVSQRSSP